MLKNKMFNPQTMSKILMVWKVKCFHHVTFSVGEFFFFSVG